MIRVSLLLISTLVVSPAIANDYHLRPEVLEFIDELVAEEDFDRTALLSIFNEASYKQSIVDAISRPAEKVLEWKDYQDIFLTKKRVEQGRRFLEENADALAAAHDLYGVPPEIVTSIIGVETMYGQIRGNYRVIDALSTLAFDYPPRSRFFRSELKHFLLLAREEKQSPTSPMGSYAGAMGYGQFIPSSYRHYAIDFDGDGFRDIWDNRVDAIGSVANYLAEHGWRARETIVLPIEVAGAGNTGLFKEDLSPSISIEQLQHRGLAGEIGEAGETKVAPLTFAGKQGPEYWLGFRNFYVITRYNHSKLYAMAVFQLSQQFRAREVADLNVD
ncbi:MAG: lytic murein transglycosylase B [Pseudomonadales bacterium]